MQLLIDYLSGLPLQMLDWFQAASVWDYIVLTFVVGVWLLPTKVIMSETLKRLAKYKKKEHTKDWRWVVLAVDIPAQNEQTPKAIEMLFSHLAGALDVPNIEAKFHHGHEQRWFSFEVVSIEGYIQFIIRTEAALQDLVEAAVYAQYPEAEIVEIEDYVHMAPEQFPSPSHDIWISDFGLAEHTGYPIRTYAELTADKLDPMGAFLESFSRIGKGENMWFQIIITPITSSWKEDVIEKIKELMGEKKKESKGPWSFVTDNPITKELAMDAQEVISQLSGGGVSDGSGDDSKKSEDDKPKLAPGQATLIKAMENKIMKIGFKTKIRAAYIAEHPVFNPNRGVQALIGAINQYNVPTANSLVPTYGSSASYLRKQKVSDTKKNKLLQAFRDRDAGTGGDDFVLNIEELATIWHFPLVHVKTPLLERASGKRAEPPTGLPIGEVISLDGNMSPGSSGAANPDDYHVTGGDYHGGQNFG